MYSLLQKYYADYGVILMFHRVRDTERSLSSNSGLDISGADLATVIEQLLAWQYDIISLDEVLSRLQQRGAKKRFAVLTFDDGYKDNLTAALPVCEYYQVPLTIYVTTCFPDKTIILWWELLETLLMNEEHLDFSWQNNHYTFTLNTKKTKECAFNKIKHMILTANIKQQRLLWDILFFARGMNNEDLCEKILLTWHEVQMLHNHPLVTIGAHTQNHLALAQLSIDDACREILQGKNILQEHLNTTIKHFAYPYGTLLAAGSREFSLAKQAKFNTAVTTRYGHLFAAHSMSPYALPRIGLCSKKIPKLKTYLSGLNALCRHRGKRVVTI